MRLTPADLYGFFYHAIPPEGVLSLEELHSIISNVWLTRHDDELEQERAARRKGRPKSTKESKLEEIKLRESEQYRTGMGKVEYHSVLPLLIALRRCA
jgi:translation machinery-associated protein 16